MTVGVKKDKEKRMNNNIKLYVLFILLIVGMTVLPMKNAEIFYPIGIMKLSYFIPLGFLYYFLGKVSFKFKSHFFVSLGLILCIVSTCIIGLVSTSILLEHPTWMGVWWYIILIGLLGFSLWLGFVYEIGKREKNLNWKQTTVQTILLLLFFNFVIPSILTNQLLEIDRLNKFDFIEESFVIILTVIAGLIAFFVQIYKNAFDISIYSIFFGNFYQDFAALNVILASLSLASINNGAFPETLIGITTFFWFIRSVTETSLYKSEIRRNFFRKRLSLKDLRIRV